MQERAWTIGVFRNWGCPCAYIAHMTRCKELLTEVTRILTRNPALGHCPPLSPLTIITSGEEYYKHAETLLVDATRQATTLPALAANASVFSAFMLTYDSTC